MISNTKKIVYVKGVSNYANSFQIPSLYECFVADVTTSAGSIKVGQTVDSSSSNGASTITSTFSTSGGLSAGLKMAKAAASIDYNRDYYSQSSQSKESLQSTYEYYVTLPVCNYKNYKLSDIGKQKLLEVNCDPVKFMQVCGNTVPSSSTYSASMVIQLKLSFSDYSFQDSFAKSYGVNTDLSGAFNRIPVALNAVVSNKDTSTKQYYSSSTSLQFSFNQIGGNIQTPAALSCTLDNISKCLDSLNNVINGASKAFSGLTAENAVESYNDLQDITLINSNLRSYTADQTSSITRAMNWLKSALKYSTSTLNDLEAILVSEKSLLNIASANDKAGLSCNFNRLLSIDTQNKIKSIQEDMKNNINYISDFVNNICINDPLSCEKNLLNRLAQNTLVLKKYTAYNLYDQDFQYAANPVMSSNTEYYYGNVWILPKGDGQYYYIPVAGTGSFKGSNPYQKVACKLAKISDLLETLHYPAINQQYGDYAPNNVDNPMWKSSYACKTSIGYAQDMKCVLKYMGFHTTGTVTCDNGMTIPGTTSFLGGGGIKYFNHALVARCGSSESKTVTATDYGTLGNASFTSSTISSCATIPVSQVTPIAVKDVIINEKINVNFPTITLDTPKTSDASIIDGLDLFGYAALFGLSVFVL